MGNRLWCKGANPSITRLGQPMPANPVSRTVGAFTPYGTTLDDKGAPVFLPSVPEMNLEDPALFYAGGAMGHDDGLLAILRDLHSHMTYTDALSSQPFTPAEVDVLVDHANTGCPQCAAYIAGGRRGAAGGRMQMRQKAEAAARKRR